jgi:glycosyltransferase involved in cell wall biosynthesis
VQNFFPLFSPSVHAAARSLNIPTIQHLHNFRLGCLNGYLLRDGMICEACVGKNPWRGVRFGCYRASRIASLAVWAMLTVNRWRRTWWHDVDAFITPSYFAAQKLKEIGIAGDRLHVKPSAIDAVNPQGIPSSQLAPLFVFVGRLSAEKGILTLLQSWIELNQEDWQLKIIGEGAEKSNLEHFIEQAGLKNVQLLGYLSPAGVTEIMQSATALVLPSQWYETFGRVAIEAFACGKPVLASNLGALSELICSERNGFLIPHDRISAWTERLLWCGTHPHEMEILGKNAYKTYQELYTRSANYQKLIEIYDRVLKERT